MDSRFPESTASLRTDYVFKPRTVGGFPSPPMNAKSCSEKRETHKISVRLERSLEEGSDALIKEKTMILDDAEKSEHIF